MKKGKAKKKVTQLLYFPMVLLIVGVALIFSYWKLSKGYYINYNEDSNVSYSVCLKDNDYYDSKCVDRGNQYIASLIDYIPANFSYNLRFPNNNIEYKYDYKIIAEFDVTDRDNDRVLFTKKEVLYSSETMTSISGININYNLDIDYNKYNGLLNSFISKYNLNETTNYLKVSMDVNVTNSKNINLGAISTKASSITIPLTTKTINIDISGTALNSNDSRILVAPTVDYTLLLVVGIILTVISLILLLVILNIIRKTRTIQEIYENRIKKIALSYDSYIQRITGDYPIGASRICKVSSFQDMLEIKESSEKPLLMLENKEKTGTFFLIPVGEGVIYTYAIRIADIESEINGTKAPDYDKDDIIGNKSKVEKFYTVDKINEDIKHTTEIEIFDDKNAIRGTNNSDEDLYDQLDNTFEFKFKNKK